MYTNNIPDLLPWFAFITFLLVLGITTSFAPWSTLLALFLVTTLSSVIIASAKLALWQKLTFLILVGYIALNYGFANWSFNLGNIPLPIAYLIAYGTLLFAIQENAQEVKAFFQEPVAIAFLILLVISIPHLLIDIPKYGAYAIRDATFVFEGIFLLLGFIWAKDSESVYLFLKTLFIVFLIIFIYSLTFPIRGFLAEHSLESGIFVKVPLLGFYRNIALFLVSGALYYYLIGKRVVNWPSLVVWIFIVFQLAWSIVFQTRSMYIGIVFAVLLLIFLGGIRKGVKLASVTIGGIILLLLLVNTFGLQIGGGKYGGLTLSFYVDHIRSLLLALGTPEIGTMRWRVEILSDAWKRWTATKANIAVGMGFGMPLTDWIDPKGTVTRQPHNTHLSVLMRLGLIGFAIWIFMQWKIFSTLLRCVRNYKQESLFQNVALWFFLFYILSMIMTSVQPWLEFPYGSIPFFTLIGFAIGLFGNSDQSEMLTPT